MGLNWRCIRKSMCSWGGTGRVQNGRSGSGWLTDLDDQEVLCGCAEWICWLGLETGRWSTETKTNL